MVECSLCKKDTKKRRLIEYKGLKDNSEKVPEPWKSEGWKESLCQNLILYRSKIGKTDSGPIYGWFNETCNNHILFRGN